MVTYVYAFVWFESLMVYLTLAYKFGMDYSYLTDYISNNYIDYFYYNKLNTLRYGAIFLTVISTKGYGTCLINMVLVVYLLIDVFKRSPSDEVSPREGRKSRGNL
ncbi:unnamed protein product [Parnassius apollo]|uniref:(apollo) hypothetical protein n=1 Tax=Parnassius apollo TaxID=110799 RepID=A0A8S3X829_PARAO|nr:unnamed protein product [Parnassius apollo]